MKPNVVKMYRFVQVFGRTGVSGAGVRKLADSVLRQDLESVKMATLDHAVGKIKSKLKLVEVELLLVQKTELFVLSERITIFAQKVVQLVLLVKTQATNVFLAVFVMRKTNSCRTEFA